VLEVKNMKYISPVINTLSKGYSALVQEVGKVRATFGRVKDTVSNAQYEEKLASGFYTSPDAEDVQRKHNETRSILKTEGFKLINGRVRPAVYHDSEGTKVLLTQQQEAVTYQITTSRRDKAFMGKGLAYILNQEGFRPSGTTSILAYALGESKLPVYVSRIKDALPSSTRDFKREVQAQDVGETTVDKENDDAIQSGVWLSGVHDLCGRWREVSGAFEIPQEVLEKEKPEGKEQESVSYMPYDNKGIRIPQSGRTSYVSGGTSGKGLEERVKKPARTHARP
jgi:hypothetical protein